MNAKDNIMPERVSNEWNTLIELTTAESRHLVHAVVLNNEEELQQRYREYLSSDAELDLLLGPEANQKEFTRRFILWINALVNPDAVSGEDFFAEQQAVGEALARIGFPPHAISRSMRKLKLWFLRHLSATDITRQQLVDAMGFVIGLFDIALEIREVSYQRGVASSVRINEAYRLHLLGQNLAMERERQRAALMEWGHSVLAAFYQNAVSGDLPKLWKAEFGLWLNHKAHILFERDPKIDIIRQSVNRIDEELVPALEQSTFNARSMIGDTTRKIEEELSSIKFALNSVFEAHIEVENGRDPLTHLLTRRFMPSVLMREIQLQKAPASSGFCLLLLDIDHFKSINDTYGHKAGDIALKRVAGAITELVRPTDFVFRYGGEEILIVLVECEATRGMQTAEKIRANVALLNISPAENVELSLTASIGVAAYEGELDYEIILSRADKAVYDAKAAGRNRIALAP